MKIVKPKKTRTSAMLHSTESPLLNEVDGIYKESSENNVEHHSNLPLPHDAKRKKKKNQINCLEYDCIPERPSGSRQTEQIPCPAPSCPSGYEIVYDKAPNSVACSKYKCELIPKKDVVCNVTGSTFNTFDSTEFKYDFCDHILVRDFSSNNWTVSRKFILFNFTIVSSKN